MHEPDPDLVEELVCRPERRDPATDLTPRILARLAAERRSRNRRLLRAYGSILLLTLALYVLTAEALVADGSLTLPLAEPLIDYSWIVHLAIGLVLLFLWLPALLRRRPR